MHTTQVQQLEDIELPEVQGSQPIDPKIQNLVRVLYKLHAVSERSQSCEGHIDPKKLPFPRVTVGVPYDSKVYRKILAMLIDYNKRSDVQWALEGICIKPNTRARNQLELEELQESANRLAHFIFENYAQI